MLTTLKPTDFADRSQPAADAGEQKRTVPKSVADWFHASIIRGRTEVFTEVVTLTPDMARLLLAANHENRAVNKRAVQTYADDIVADRWSLNGESIKVATDGDLNDGQHRCWAVVEAGKPIQTAITFGLPRASRLTLDQGKSRSTADYLSIESSVKYASLCAGIAKALWLYRRGVTDGGATSPTRLTIRAEYWTYEREINAAAYFVGAKFGGRIIGGPVPVATAFVIARRMDSRAEDFFERLIKGTDLKDGDPILTVRNRFLSGQRIRPEDKVRVIVRAFEAWLDGNKLSRVYVKSDRVKKAGRK